MPGDFSCRIRLAGGGVRFMGSSPDLPEIAMDVPPPIGAGQGYGPMELLLLSLTSCITMTMTVLLRRRGQNRVEQVAAETEGFLREEPVAALDTVRIALSLTSDDVDGDAVQKALDKAKSGPSVVWARLSGNIAIQIAVTVARSDNTVFTVHYEDPLRP